MWPCSSSCLARGPQLLQVLGHAEHHTLGHVKPSKPLVNRSRHRRARGCGIQCSCCAAAAVSAAAASLPESGHVNAWQQALQVMRRHKVHWAPVQALPSRLRWQRQGWGALLRRLLLPQRQLLLLSLLCQARRARHVLHLLLVRRAPQHAIAPHKRG